MKAISEIPDSFKSQQIPQNSRKNPIIKEVQILEIISVRKTDGLAWEVNLVTICYVFRLEIDLFYLILT